jgi:hypothetical protein
MSHPNDEHPQDATTDYVRSALRDAAQGHQPNRRAIAHRVAAGRAPRRAKSRRGVYPVAAAFAVAVIVVFSVVLVRSSGNDGTHRTANPPAAVAALPSEKTSSPAPTARRSSPTPGRSATSTAPNGWLTAKGGLDANSVATWTQNNVTITNTKALASLRVTITVDLTPGAAEAGRYTNVPNADVTMTVTRGASALTYAYVLKQGTNLAPGSYIFAAQFQHRSGRMMSNDSYTVAASTRTTHADLSGAFG